MPTLPQHLRRSLVKLTSKFRKVSKAETRYRILLLELPIVPRDELYRRLRAKNPTHKEGAAFVGCSDEMGTAKLLQKIKQWENGTLRYLRKEGPLVKHGVANCPCVFLGKYSDEGRAECELYRVDADTYVAWELEESDGRASRWLARPVKVAPR